jgi:hypothetical protein
VVQQAFDKCRPTCATLTHATCACRVALIGESVPVEKHVCVSVVETPALADRTNMVNATTLATPTGQRCS